MRKIDDSIIITSLFKEIPYPIKNLFYDATYPWEIIPKISSYIRMLIDNKDTMLKEYRMISEGVFVGYNVTISPLSTIIPPAIIGSGTEIRPGAYLRGNVIIGEKCVIGNSTEIKNSILLKHANAPHYNYIGDSILGNHSHLGAGVICSNLKSDKSNIVVKSPEDNYETNLRKMGAILGDNVEVGCGSVLNPGTIICANTTIYPLTNVRGVVGENSIMKSKNQIIKKQ